MKKIILLFLLLLYSCNTSGTYLTDSICALSINAYNQLTFSNNFEVMEMFKSNLVVNITHGTPVSIIYVKNNVACVEVKSGFYSGKIIFCNPGKIYDN